MTDEEVGKYIRLLCAQHQHGGLIDKTSFCITIGDSKLLKDRFIETDDGYYNNRLMEEMVKRERKSTNLSANAKKRWAMQKQCNCIATAMPTENENEDVNVIKNRRRKPFKKPTIQEVRNFFNENGYDPDFGETRWHYYDDADWHDSHGSAVLNWKQKMRSVWFTDEHKKKPSFMMP